MGISEIVSIIVFALLFVLAIFITRWIDKKEAARDKGFPRSRGRDK